MPSTVQANVSPMPVDMTSIQEDDFLKIKIVIIIIIKKKKKGVILAEGTEMLLVNGNNRRGENILMATAEKDGNRIRVNFDTNGKEYKVDFKKGILLSKDLSLKLGFEDQVRLGGGTIDGNNSTMQIYPSRS